MTDDGSPGPRVGGDPQTPAGGPRSRPRRSTPAEAGKRRRRRSAEEEGELEPVAPTSQASQASERDGEADEAEEPKAARDPNVPAFARGWPKDDALTKLVEAFEAGDYGRVRAAAPELERTTDDDDVRVAARELVRRTEPDPLAVRMLGATALLLMFLAGWYWSHPHHP